ncbi:hypothetical protein D3C79_555680 [compost metagenome]
MFDNRSSQVGVLDAGKLRTLPAVLEECWIRPSLGGAERGKKHLDAPIRLEAAQGITQVGWQGAVIKDDTAQLVQVTACYSQYCFGTL